jgi:glycerol transport system ATP-binding protein
MTVHENIASPPRVAGADQARIDRAVRRAADLLRLTPYLGRTWQCRERAKRGTTLSAID